MLVLQLVNAVEIFAGHFLRKNFVLFYRRFHFVHWQAVRNVGRILS